MSDELDLKMIYGLVADDTEVPEGYYPTREVGWNLNDEAAICFIKDHPGHRFVIGVR